MPSESGPSTPRLDDPNSGGFSVSGDAQRALEHLDSTYRLGPALGYEAPVPEPNLGDRERTSWLTRVLSVVPAAASRDASR